MRETSHEEMWRRRNGRFLLGGSEKRGKEKANSCHPLQTQKVTLASVKKYNFDTWIGLLPI